MDQDPILQNHVNLAWATPFHLAQLGARLEAYAETKAAITTFRFAARSKFLSKLPEEIISNIADKVRDTVVRHKMIKWTKINSCLSNTCTSSSHLRRSDVDFVDNFGSSNVYRRVSERLEQGAAEQHQKDVRRYYNMLTDPNRSSKFAKCVQIFQQDFGIRPYLVMRKFYKLREVFVLAHVKVQAFLTLPIMLGPISSNPVPEAAFISVCKTIDPSALKDLSESQRQQFHIATNTLNLRPCDVEEGGAWFTDKDRMRVVHSSDGWSDAGWSEDDSDVDDGDSTESDVDLLGQVLPQDQYTAVQARQSREIKAETDLPDENDPVAISAEGSSDREAMRNVIASSSAPHIKHIDEGLDTDVKAEKPKVWPEFMILGCGKVNAYHEYGWARIRYGGHCLS